ncbi:unnamed protein product [Callosobruchus maculatus]|uniref:THAP-type domain-containing protein n=1 Tax=Callosobruchus maculatus TaxID=64391 RepID=A0A653CIF1_CALMS|nr:unnamed protein product [Callosobruchus maculatus]
MLVCVNSSWKIPVGYFFLNGLAGSEKAELVRKCLSFLHESGITVSSLTFDGAAVNFAMASHLGADFKDPKQLKTSFTHPVTGDDVFIFLDPCHMIKLVRNTFGSQKLLNDDANNQIDWNFIVRLCDAQYDQGLHLGTKLRSRHLGWSREKMKVKLATQTLSKSVADALLYLSQDLKSPQFANAEPTARFVELFSNIFDVFNSRNRFAKYHFKRPLSPATEDSFFEFLNKMEEYIHSLKLNNTPISQSPRKVGFLGFLICIKSLKLFYQKYCIESHHLKYVLTNKLSQDHLELFFGAIRSKGGFNNNPSARQFEAAYKRLLVHTEIGGPSSGNISLNENLPILSCGSGQKLTVDDEGTDMLSTTEYSDFLQKIKNDIAIYQSSSYAWGLTMFNEDVVAYISGFVVRSLKKYISCEKCKDLLESETVVSLLQRRKQFGNLIIASAMVINVCRAAEKYFRFFSKTTGLFNSHVKNVSLLLINNTMETLPSTIFSFFQNHLYDDDPIDGHASQLIKLILKQYFNLRIHHETVKKADESRSTRIRSVFTKTILFSHQ